MLRRLKKKFRGWVYPKTMLQQFTAHFDYAHRHKHSSLVGPVVGLRLGAHVFTKPIATKKLYHERFVYVGCVHGGNEDIYKRLAALPHDPPDYLIFTGDLTGCSYLERLKKYFYDEKEKNPKGRFARYNYFGDWAGTLPGKVRQEIMKGLLPSVQKLLAILQKIEKKGTKIFIVEGNWDNPLTTGINAIMGDPPSLPIKSGLRRASMGEMGKKRKMAGMTERFFAGHGFHFINNLKLLKTKTTLHIFLPYITLLHFDKISKYRIREVEKEILDAQHEYKSIIMVGHAEANWKIHHLDKNTPLFGSDRIKVIRNFGRAMAIFKPHEVIYPHEHGRIRDENEYLLSLDAKYLLQIVGYGGDEGYGGDRGHVRLVTDPLKVGKGDGQIIATYIPFGYLAEEEFTGR